VKACFALVSLALSGCVGLTQQKGTLTVLGNGTKAIVKKGDPLMNTGVYAKEVPPDFSAGLAKGEGDAVEREFEAVQDRCARGEGTGISAPAADVGTPHDYKVTVPESVDANGVKRPPEIKVITIVEFMARKGRL
jgi:hypothetical protein